MKKFITVTINYQNLVISYFAYIPSGMHFQIVVIDYNNKLIDYFDPTKQSSNCNKI